MFSFVFFYVTYKVSKKAALALVYKPQWKCFQGSCLGLKISNKVRQMLNYLIQITLNKIL